MNDYLNPTDIDLGAGHTLKPNGLGDYEFHCPVMGFEKFVPIMMRMTLPGRECPCGHTIRDFYKDGT